MPYDPNDEGWKKLKASKNVCAMIFTTMCELAEKDAHNPPPVNNSNNERNLDDEKA